MAQNGEDHTKRIAQEAARFRPIAEAAQAQGLKVGLYNHGGFFGEPETQVEIIKALNMPNVGIVYNLHHGHAHVRRMRQILELIKPHLICLNLNGMVEDSDKRGMKIVPLAQGEQDLDILKIIAASGYQGPIGILNHDGGADAAIRLQDNLDGLRWLLKSMRGEAAVPIRSRRVGNARRKSRRRRRGPVPLLDAGRNQSSASCVYD